MSQLRALLLTLIVGAVAGWLAGVISKGSGFGLLGNVIVGILGAFLGSLCLGLLGIAATNLIGHLIVAVVGALLLVWLLQFVKR